MRLQLLYEQILTYEQFIQQPKWEDILYHNYCINQPPLAAPDPALNTLDNDTDRFPRARNIGVYLNRCNLPEPARNHLARALILKTKSPRHAYHYALVVIKGRWPEAENIIKQWPFYAHLYARDVIKGRWPEAEEIIRQDSECAYWYARGVIKGRWPEAEGIISQNQHWWGEYRIIFNMGY